jgi:hypothetical protein
MPDTTLKRQEAGGDRYNTIHIRQHKISTHIIRSPFVAFTKYLPVTHTGKGGKRQIIVLDYPNFRRGRHAINLPQRPKPWFS